jgi:uncharacterized protein YbjT (DUF2867 family)
MRVILTGATGFVGGEVLTQLLAHPAITGVACLTRRALTVKSSKLTTIVHEDFTRFFRRSKLKTDQSEGRAVSKR